MSYTSSQSFQGDGALLSIGPVAGTASPTYTPVFEVTSSPLPVAQWNKIDVTNLSSPNNAKEFRKGMIDFGEMTVKGNTVVADPGQLAMAAAFADKTNPYMFSITLPVAPGQSTSGNVYKFSGLVLGWTAVSSLEASKTVEFEAKIQITGAVSVTAGS